MALSRLQLLSLRPPHYPSLLPKYPSLLSSTSTSTSTSTVAGFRWRGRPRFSALRILCSQSDPTDPAAGESSIPPPTPPPPSSIVGDLLDYLNESWTQFHATADAKRQLLAAGFQPLNESDDWDLQPGGRYFFTRNMSSLVAFAVGEKYSVGSGFHVIAAHTDSPCLKLKPRSAGSKAGYLMVNVQTYGSGLWHTWFDRDLSVAGRVILKAGDGSYVHKLVKVKRPILRVPTLAIHLDREH